MTNTTPFPLLKEIQIWKYYENVHIPFVLPAREYIITETKSNN